MVDRASLSPQALAWLDGLSPGDRLALLKSNDTFAALAYQARMSARANQVLYQRLPEPDIPSNQLLDELDSQ